jgi:hypothetical protein
MLTFLDAFLHIKNAYMHDLDPDNEATLWVSGGWGAYHRILYFQCPHQGMSFTAKYLAESQAKFLCYLGFSRRIFGFLPKNKWRENFFFVTVPSSLKLTQE